MSKLFTPLTRPVVLLWQQVKRTPDAPVNVGLWKPLPWVASPAWLLAACLLLTVLVCITLLDQLHGRDDVRSAQVQLELLQVRLEGEFPAAPFSGKLASALPHSVDVSGILTKIQKMAVTNSLNLLRAEQSKLTQDLSRSGLHKYVFDLRLSGGYLDLKTFLAQILVESPDLWLGRLQLQAEGSTVIASISLHAWSTDFNPTQPARSSPTP